MISPKLKPWLWAIIILVSAAAAVLYFSPFRAKERLPEVESTAGRQTYNFILADTPEEIIKGLSGLELLPEDTVLLFTYERDNSCGVWMKDMKFSIDVVWLDSNFKVVDFARGLEPATFPRVFSPVRPCRYFIEANEGFVKANGIRRGSSVFIDFTNSSLSF